MLYVVFKDRLGNNLFQFAAAISLSSEVTICVPNPNEYDAVLRFKDTFFKGFPIINYVPQGVEVYEEVDYQFNEIPYNEDVNLVISGCFQSYRYIDRTKVLPLYKVSESYYSEIRNRFSFLFDGNEYTSIHVRRGDYLKYPYKHPFCGKKYYSDAIDCIGRDKKFVVLSDDIQWCKKNIKGIDAKFIEGTNLMIDFYIQTLCANNIISNSSFSWWASFLNENQKKTVVVPKLWFGFKFKVDVKDLIPQSYVVVRNQYRLSQYLMSAYYLSLNKIKYLFDYDK